MTSSIREGFFCAGAGLGTPEISCQQPKQCQALFFSCARSIIPSLAGRGPPNLFLALRFLQVWIFFSLSIAVGQLEQQVCVILSSIRSPGQPFHCILFCNLLSPRNSITRVSWACCVSPAYSSPNAGKGVSFAHYSRVWSSSQLTCSWSSCCFLLLLWVSLSSRKFPTLHSLSQHCLPDDITREYCVHV